MLFFHFSAWRETLQYLIFFLFGFSIRWISKWTLLDEKLLAGQHCIWIPVLFHCLKSLFLKRTVFGNSHLIDFRRLVMFDSVHIQWFVIIFFQSKGWSVMPWILYMSLYSRDKEKSEVTLCQTSKHQAPVLQDTFRTFCRSLQTMTPSAVTFIFLCVNQVKPYKLLPGGSWVTSCPIHVQTCLHVLAEHVWTRACGHLCVCV